MQITLNEVSALFQICIMHPKKGVCAVSVSITVALCSLVRNSMMHKLKAVPMRYLLHVHKESYHVTTVITADRFLDVGSL